MKQAALRILLFWAFLAPQLINAQSPPCGEWKQHFTNGNTRVFMRECPESPIKEFKVLDRFYGNFDKVKVVMDDVKTTQRISDYCTEAVLVKNIDKNTVEQYFYFDMPMGINDRDIISKNTTYQTANTYTSISEVYYDNSIKERDGVIRLKKVRSSFYFEKMPDGTIKMEYIAFADPNGWVPAWIINLLASSQARKMVEKLKNLMQ